ncbi:MAG: hypothetical protein Tsb0016_13200 [Sphingomonadales bacterium]
MADIVISEFMDEEVIAKAFAGRDVLYDPGLVDQADALRKAVADARALLVRNRTQVRGGLLAAARRLQVVGRLGVGLDNIDLDGCTARGIKVCPATGANDDAVAEYVITAALILLRGAWHAQAEVTAGDWPRMALVGHEIGGKTMGLVGYGAIAREVAHRAKALGMNVTAADPYLAMDDPRWNEVHRLPLKALIASADVLSLHVPLTKDTRHIIDADAIRLMKPGAVLINAARGGVVDERALAAALKSGHLGGVALDVFETEPLTAQAGSAFAGIKNLLLTPHIAGVTHESNTRVSQVTAENVLKVLEA